MRWQYLGYDSTGVEFPLHFPYVQYIPPLMEISMNRILSTTAFLFLFCSMALAQRPTGISAQMLQDLRTCCPADAHFRAGQNALAQTDGRKLVPDWQKIISVDAHFTHRL